MYFHLSDLMRRASLTQRVLSNEIGITEVQFSKKLNGKFDWNVKEMLKIQEILNSKLKTEYTLDYIFLTE